MRSKPKPIPKKKRPNENENKVVRALPEDECDKPVWLANVQDFETLSKVKGNFACDLCPKEFPYWCKSYAILAFHRKQHSQDLVLISCCKAVSSYLANPKIWDDRDVVSRKNEMQGITMECRFKGCSGEFVTKVCK